MGDSNSSTKQNIGEQIKRIRRLRGFLLTDLQEKTGIHYTWLSRIENGRAVPTDDELARIKAALNWTPEIDVHLEAIAK